MTSKLAIFRRQATLGARVTLRLSRGEDVSGRITELNEAYVSLDVGVRTITIFDDLLAGFEVHRDCNADVPTDDHRDRSSTVDDPSNEAVRDSAAKGSSGPTPQSLPKPKDEEPDIVVVLARIQSFFPAALSRARLRQPEPDFSFPREQFPSGAIDGVRREWDRARNRYQYALKVNELSRISNIIAQVWEPLATHYPASPATRSLLGRAWLKLDHASKAKDHLAAAAALSRRTGPLAGSCCRRRGHCTRVLRTTTPLPNHSSMGRARRVVSLSFRCYKSP